MINDVPPNQVVVGNHAKFLRMNEQKYDISFFNKNSTTSIRSPDFI